MGSTPRREEQVPEQKYKDRDGRRRKKEFSVTPEIKVVYIESLFMLHPHKIFQEPDYPVSEPVFPQEQIYDGHDTAGNKDIKAKPAHDLCLKGCIFFFLTILQFYIQLPTPS